ncbi:MAG: lipoate-protein ligase A [Elusimicrobia bacterium]|nr:MAG: lipoate-protein ligase A [Elusimicrobiota bacterium]KAF0157121.1 MAG: lipoate-protein ligase A [Elusimicrobiota bacterium]
MKGLLIDSPAADVCWQMAMDEALCETMPAPFILRFFRWQAPGITFGYAQRAREVEAAAAARGLSGTEMTRRPTGGGIVYHLSDLTFSLIFPSEGGDFRPMETYDRLHRAINAAYGRLGSGFELSDARTAGYAVSAPAMDCFSKPVPLDILYNGKKVLGGALRKFGGHMLYQASFQTEDARTGAARHEAAIAEGLAGGLGADWEKAPLAEEARIRAEALATEKYRSAEWIKRI